MKNKKNILFFLFTLVAVLLSINIGPSGWGVKDSYIIWNIRLPRIAAALVAGAGLGVSGAVFQAIMRNPLAAPYVAGTSAGAALGIALASLAGLSFLGPAAGFAAGLALTAAVYRISIYSRRSSPESLILAGVVMSSLASAVTFLIMVLNKDSVYRIMFFLTGSFQFASPSLLIISAIIIAAGTAVSILFGRDLDIMTQGDGPAFSLGVDPVKKRKLLFGVAAVMVAASVSVGGIIAFAGLAVPHIVRMISGAAHRRLLILSAIFGAGFLVFSDALARSLFAPMEIPAGIITAFFGAPFFLYILTRK